MSTIKTSIVLAIARNLKDKGITQADVYHAVWDEGIKVIDDLPKEPLRDGESHYSL